LKRIINYNEPLYQTYIFIMNKFNFLLISVFFLCFFSACKKEVTPKNQEFGVVINELMPLNSTIVADQNGEYDDWIELYNKLDTIVDLSGYYLTDSKRNPAKWKFPTGTIILADSFLIVWADGDTLQKGEPIQVYGYHSNFKLSSSGETVIFLSPEFEEIDRVKYDSIGVQQSYARIPNGTGEFSWQQRPSFNGRNIPN
jgi:hypothetical protein